MKTEILGIGFDDLLLGEAVRRALEIIGGPGKAYIVTPNPEIAWLAQKNEKLREALNGAGLVLADGIGVIIAARMLKTPLSEKIPGIEFAAALLGAVAATGGSVYLLGAKPGVAQVAAGKLKESHHGLVIAGTADGYFSDDKKAIEKINAANPDVLLVCLGAPRQEIWMAENLGALNVKLCVGLGGSLDVFAGRVKRAPIFFRKLELEWLYRLISNPRRLKRMMKLPLFLLAVAFSKRKSVIDYE